VFNFGVVPLSLPALPESLRVSGKRGKPAEEAADSCPPAEGPVGAEQEENTSNGQLLGGS